MSNPPTKAAERRTFLGILLAGIGAVVAGAFSWPLFRYLAPIDKGDEESQVRLTRQQVARAGIFDGGHGAVHGALADQRGHGGGVVVFADEPRDRHAGPDRLGQRGQLPTSLADRHLQQHLRRSHHHGTCDHLRGQRRNQRQ